MSLREENASHLALKSDETDLVGAWVKDEGRIVGDAVEMRIDWLISCALQKIAVNRVSGGWETLYRDPRDERYWELTYPQGEMHGGGPKQLKNLPTATVLAKYND